jgi:hypothetical protein
MIVSSLDRAGDDDRQHRARGDEQLGCTRHR